LRQILNLRPVHSKIIRLGSVQNCV
jgi:hypothetical protein